MICNTAPFGSKTSAVRNEFLVSHRRGATHRVRRPLRRRAAAGPAQDPHQTGQQTQAIRRGQFPGRQSWPLKRSYAPFRVAPPPEGLLVSHGYRYDRAPPDRRWHTDSHLRSASKASGTKHRRHSCRSGQTPHSARSPPSAQPCQNQQWAWHGEFLRPAELRHLFPFDQAKDNSTCVKPVDWISDKGLVFIHDFHDS